MFGEGRLSPCDALQRSWRCSASFTPGVSTRMLNRTSTEVPGNPWAPQATERARSGKAGIRSWIPAILWNLSTSFACSRVSFGPAGLSECSDQAVCARHVLQKHQTCLFRSGGPGILFSAFLGQQKHKETPTHDIDPQYPVRPHEETRYRSPTLPPSPHEIRTVQWRTFPAWRRFAV